MVWCHKLEIMSGLVSLPFFIYEGMHVSPFFFLSYGMSNGEKIGGSVAKVVEGLLEWILVFLLKYGYESRDP